MNKVLEYILKFRTDAEKVAAKIEKIEKSVNDSRNAVVRFTDTFSKGLDSLNKKIDTIHLDSMLNNIERVANGVDSLNKPGLALNTELAELSAIADVTGRKLTEIESLGRKNAKTYGGDAAQSMTSYKLILSQLNPEIAKAPKALASMGKSVSLTSKLMKNDTVAATELLTTAMNQFEVSTANPIQAADEMAVMMNVMGAAAQKGSAEFPQIKSALQQSGLAAKKANVSFAETNAAIQVFDKNGKKGSEGGVALRNVLATLSQGRFLPKDVQQELQSAGVNIEALTDKNTTLADRLRPLQSILGDSALVTKLFGKENQSAALSIISNIDELETLTGAIENTNSVNEQAARIMDSQAEKNARMKARIDDLKISLFNATGGVIGYASELGRLAFDISNLIPMFVGFSNAIAWVTNAEKVQTFWTTAVTTATLGWAKVQGILNLALSPMFLIPAIVVAIGAAIMWVASKTEGWKEAWEWTLIGARLAFQGFVEFVKTYYLGLYSGFMIGLNKIKEGWFEFRKLIGVGDKAENQAALDRIREDTEKRKKAVSDGLRKTRDLFKRSGQTFKVAASSIKVREKTEQTISNPSLVGAVTGDNTNNNTNNNNNNKVGATTNKAIATGGTKHTYNTFNIQKLTDIIIKGDDFKENTEKMKEELLDQLLRVLGIAATASS